MVIALLTLLTGLVLLAEIRLQADFHHGDSTQASIFVGLGGFHKTWQGMLIRSGNGHQVLVGSEMRVRPLAVQSLEQNPGRSLLSLFRRANRARHFLLTHIHLDQLDALALLRTQDAARSALLAGTFRSIAACIPPLRRRPVRIRVLPEFFRAHSTVNARCIIRVRVGTILLTAMMLLTAYLRQRRLTESEAG